MLFLISLQLSGPCWWVVKRGRSRPGQFPGCWTRQNVALSHIHIYVPVEAEPRGPKSPDEGCKDREGSGRVLCVSCVCMLCCGVRVCAYSHTHSVNIVIR